MPDQPLDFSFDMTNVDREEIMRQSGDYLDQLSGRLGDSGSAVQQTERGDQARALKEDYAVLPEKPDIYRISDQDFLGRQLPVPVRFEEMARQYNFYWLRFQVGLMPSLGWAFNRLEVKVEFNPGGAPNSRPKSYQILPDRKFQDLLRINTNLDMTLNENFEFAAKAALPAGGVGIEGARLEAGAAVEAKAAAGMHMIAGPFRYRIAAARIDHNNAGMEWVFWRLVGAEFFQENQPELIVIAQVPKQTRELKINAVMQAYRTFNFLAADFRTAIEQLPQGLLAFFRAGLPTKPDLKCYHLTEFL